MRLGRIVSSWPFFLGRTVAILAIGSSTVSGQEPEFAWVRAAGGAGDDRAQGLVLDHRQGAIYFVGKFEDRASFGGLTVSNDTYNGLFVAKYDSQGGVQWVRSPSLAMAPGMVGGAGADAHGAAVDSINNIYVAGSFYGVLDTGAARLTNNSDGLGAGDVLIAKYDTEGTPLWARRAGVENQRDSAQAIAVGVDGRVHVTGYFENGIDFASTSLVGAGGLDAFHATYDGSGNLIWARKAGGPADDIAHGLAVDSQGNSYVVGEFRTNISLGVFSLAGPDVSVFLAKYNSQGTVTRARRIGGGLTNYAGASVTIDALGQVYVTGSFGALAAFEGTSLSSSGRSDVFVAKYSTTDELLWVRRAGGSGADFGRGIGVDAIGNCYVMGEFEGTVVFGADILTSAGGTDLFVAKYDPNGEIIWAARGGGTGSETGGGLTVSGGGDAYLAGSFLEQTTMGGVSLSGLGGEDLFLATLPGNNPPFIVRQPLSVGVGANSNATFSVAATGTPPLHYQWQRNGNDLDGATNFILSLRMVATNEDGNYRVIVSNNFGMVTSTVATVSVGLGVSILKHPLSQVVPVGSTVVLAVEATGSQPVTYQWQFGGFDISAATTPTLVIPNAQPGSSGDYRVRMTNPYSVVNSEVATLTIGYAIDVAATAGGTVTREPDLPIYPAGSVVRLRAVVGSNALFGSWSGHASGSANPLDVIADGHKSITAHFDTMTSLMISIVGGGIATLTPNKSQYTYGESVTLAAVPDRYFRFDRWNDGLTTNPRMITISPGALNSYTAFFAPTSALESLTFSNVNRVAPVGMPAVFVDGEFVLTPEITRVGRADLSLLTTFTRGTIFYTLDGSAPSFSSSLYQAPFTLHRSATLRAVAYDANFGQAIETDPLEIRLLKAYTVTADTAGGGLVEVLPASAAYQSNAPVTLRAIPAPGWVFLQWLGDATGTQSNYLTVVRRNLCVQALFGTSLATTMIGQGSIRVDPATALHPYGSVVRLTALPSPGYAFAAWGNAMASTNNPLLLTITNAELTTVSCAFSQLSPGQVALAVPVTGWGKVRLNPEANRFTVGQTVTLIAEPDEGEQFLGWSGLPGGTNTTATVQLTQSSIIEAAFSARPQFLPGPCAAGWDIDEGFRLTFRGMINRHYAVERSTNLMDWLSIGTVTNRHGLNQVRDIDATNSSSGFYRAHEIRD